MCSLLFMPNAREIRCITDLNETARKVCMYAQPILLFFTNILRAQGNQYPPSVDKQNLAAYSESPSHACFLKTLASPSPITSLTFRCFKNIREMRCITDLGGELMR